jgi:hypothetical protein
MIGCTVCALNITVVHYYMFLGKFEEEKYDFDEQF